MSCEFYNKRDDARPFFQRLKGEIGVYVSVYSAVAKEERSYGLEHYFIMHTMEILYNEFCAMDMVHLRAAFLKKGVLKNSYIHRFDQGIVMSVGFDNHQALDALWKLHKAKKLNPLLQTILLTPAVLKATETLKITLDTKLWEDEYTPCREELLNPTTQIENIRFMVNDMRMVKRLQNYQKVMAETVQIMKTLDSDMDLKQADFANCLHRIVPEDCETIKTLKEYDTIIRTGKGAELYNRNSLEVYDSTIHAWRKYFKTFELEICTPLLQIHKTCENDRQKETKADILSRIVEMRRLLKPDTDLQKVKHADLARTLITTDAQLVLGLLSLIPIGVETIVDIDIQIDAYIREFKFDEEDWKVELMLAKQNKTAKTEASTDEKTDKTEADTDEAETPKQTSDERVDGASKSGTQQRDKVQDEIETEREN